MMTFYMNFIHIMPHRPSIMVISIDYYLEPNTYGGLLFKDDRISFTGLLGIAAFARFSVYRRFSKSLI